MQLSPLGGLKRFYIAFVLAAALGCGDAGTISGKVAINGTVVKGGNISFIAADGKGVNAQIGEDGTYRAANVPPGDAKVTVDNQALKAAMNSPGASKPPPGFEPPGGYKGAGDPEEAKRRYVPIPDVYADPAKTPLSYTVKSGSQTYDPPLK